MSYEFTKIKKGSLGFTLLLSKTVRVNTSSMSVAADVVDGVADAWLKFDVDTNRNAIRVRRGTEAGKRSYHFTRSNTGICVNTTLPSEFKKLIQEGKLSKGDYKLDPDTQNVFVLV